MARLAPRCFANSAARSTAALLPEMTVWSGEFRFAAWQTSPCADSSQICCTFSLDSARMAAIAPTPTGTRLLHILAAIANGAHRIREREGTRSHVRRILPQAVSRDVGRRDRFGLKHAPCRDRHRQDRRLRDLGQLKLVFGTLEAELRKLVAESIVGFVECLLRHRIQGGKFLAHSNRLRTLSGKEKCDGRRVRTHRASLNLCS